jgi:hypothetical protein
LTGDSCRIEINIASLAGQRESSNNCPRRRIGRDFSVCSSGDFQSADVHKQWHPLPAARCWVAGGMVGNAVLAYRF